MNSTRATASNKDSETKKTIRIFAWASFLNDMGSDIIYPVKIGRKKVLILSFILWGLVCISFILFRGYLAVILTFVLYGMHRGALEPVQKTFISELASREYRASTLGGFQMVIGLCALPASFIAGLLWDKVSILAPFYFSLGLTALSLVVLKFVKEK